MISLSGFGYEDTLKNPSKLFETTWQSKSFINGPAVKKFEKSAFFVLGVIFLLAAILSTYHFGIEQGFFEESVVCGAKNALNAITKDELLRELSEKTISCKDVTFRIFGLSLTSINILLNLFIIFILTHDFFFYDEK